MARKPQSMLGPAQPGFALEDYVLYNLVQSAATYNTEMAKALKQCRLDTTKWRVLMLLHDRSPSSIGEIARRSVTKLPTLTRVLDRMEADGLVVRKSSAGDKRVVQVIMTPKAIRTLKEAQAIGQKVFERAIDGASAAEIAALTATLKRMRANLLRSPYEPAVGRAGARKEVAS
jgi:DNA-binding MarR family transcriptional regulator